jgi:hypothetical protein
MPPPPEDTVHLGEPVVDLLLHTVRGARCVEQAVPVEEVGGLVVVGRRSLRRLLRRERRGGAATRAHIGRVERDETERADRVGEVAEVDAVELAVVTAEHHEPGVRVGPCPPQPTPVGDVRGGDVAVGDVQVEDVGDQVPVRGPPVSSEEHVTHRTPRGRG